jgi:hypothetical protein
MEDISSQEAQRSTDFTSPPLPSKQPTYMVGYTARGLPVYRGGVVAGPDYTGGMWALSNKGKRYAVKADRVKNYLQKPKQLEI